MAFNRRQARPLCTDTEYALFTASLADAITDLTPAQLRSKLERARRARDKYRDLVKRQRLANRTRTGTNKGNRPETNARTAEKAQLFAEALARFETRASKLAAAAEREANREANREAKREAAKQALAAQSAKRRKAGAARAAALGKPKGKGGKAAGDKTGYASESARVAARDKLGRDTGRALARDRKPRRSGAARRGVTPAARWCRSRSAGKPSGCPADSVHRGHDSGTGWENCPVRRVAPCNSGWWPRRADSHCLPPDLKLSPRSRRV